MWYTSKKALLTGLIVFSPVALAASSSMDCMVEPNQKVELAASVYGVLSDVAVQRGDKVAKGQVVASLTYGTEAAAVELAKARVAFGERKAVRNAELYKDELISIHEKDEMDTEILISKLQLRQAREELKLRRVISPIDGYVVERDKDPGEYVEREPLLTVVSLDPLNIEVVVPSEKMKQFNEGMIGKVSLHNNDSKVYSAKVALVDKVIDAASGTIRVRLELPNPKGVIPAGLKCSVAFEDNSSPAVAKQ